MTKVAPHCRIGRVRMKNGGAVVRVFESKREKTSQEMASALKAQAKYLGDHFDGRMAGFVTIAWDDEGSYVLRWATQLPGIMSNNLPEYLAEAMRRELAERDARALLNDEM